MSAGIHLSRAGSAAKDIAAALRAQGISVTQENVKEAKYHSKPKVFDGVRYHSSREADYAAELSMRLRAGDIKGWRRQVRMPLKVNGVLVATYALDFVIEHCDGPEEYVEVKGFATALWKLKWRLFEALYPDLKKTIVK